MNGGTKKVLSFAPVVIFLLGQLLWAIWWASAVTTKLDQLARDTDEIEQAINVGMRDRYTGTDADRDWYRHQLKHEKEK